MVYIPKSNFSDLEEIPKEIKESLEIVEVENFDDVYTKFFK